MQLIQDICALFDTQVCFTIKHDPFRACSATPFDFVWTVITANEMNNYTSVFFAFTHKLRLVIRKMIKERKSNCFDEGCFTGAIGAMDSSCTAPKIYSDIAITFNVL